MNMEIFQKLSQKEQKSYIDKLDWAYYSKDESLVTDVEYDNYRKEYEKRYGIESLDYVPGTVSSDFVKYVHDNPIISLAKFQENETDDILLAWKKLTPIAIEPKYDGLTVVAYPKNDGSAMFVTRGSGIQGEVLPNFIEKYEGNINFNSKYPIRGEVLLPHDAFTRIVSLQKASGVEPFKQIRNAAAGILRKKERSQYINELIFICYDVIGLDEAESEKIKYIKEHSPFEVTVYDKINIIPKKENIKSFIDAMRQMYAKLSEKYPLDGMVIKTLQDKSLERFGSTGHHPNNSYAIKWNQEEVETILRDVIWQMGRSKATPVGIVDPVQIDGTTVSRVSLHNAEQIKQLGLKIGAKVAIIKANQIIPQITRVIEPGDKDIVLNVCPACGGPLEEVNGQQFCVNPDCKERIAQNIAFLGAKDVLDIPGLSIQTARKIVEAFSEKVSVSKQNVIFMLTAEELETLPGFAKKSAVKLFQSIYAATQNVELPRFIKALCIPGIGNDIGKILADEFVNLDTMHRMFSPDENDAEDAIDKLITINGIGPVAAEKLVSEEFWQAAEDLFDVIKVAPYKKKDVVAGEFVGKTFVLTGKMAHPRSYYVELIEKAGGKEGSSVSKTTDYLVLADVNSQSSKAKKARELGTKLISPEELEEMLV